MVRIRHRVMSHVRLGAVTILSLVLSGAVFEPPRQEHGTEALDGPTILAQRGNDLDRGLRHYTGTGARQDLGRAFEFFERACSQGVAEGCRRMGIQLRYGQGVPRDLPRAAEVLITACNGRDALGCAEVASMAREARTGGSLDSTRRLALNQVVCARDDWDACYFVAGGGTDVSLPAIRRDRAIDERSCRVGGHSPSCSVLIQLYTGHTAGREPWAASLMDVLEPGCRAGASSACRHQTAWARSAELARQCEQGRVVSNCDTLIALIRENRGSAQLLQHWQTTGCQVGSAGACAAAGNLPRACNQLGDASACETLANRALTNRDFQNYAAHLQQGCNNGARSQCTRLESYNDQVRAAQRELRAARTTHRRSEVSAYIQRYERACCAAEVQQARSRLQQLEALHAEWQRRRALSNPETAAAQLRAFLRDNPNFESASQVRADISTMDQRAAQRAVAQRERERVQQQQEDARRRENERQEQERQRRMSDPAWLMRCQLYCEGAVRCCEGHASRTIRSRGLRDAGTPYPLPGGHVWGRFDVTYGDCRSEHSNCLSRCTRGLADARWLWCWTGL